MPSRTPSHCACGTNFSVDYALSCPKGGFPSICHDEVRNITAELLSEVCHDVEVEPHLQPLSDERFQQKTANTQDGARLDIAMNGFWVVVMKNVIRTSEFLTHLHHPTVQPPFSHVTGNTN